MAGTWVRKKNYYQVRVLGGQYSAHRLVYFLRNNEDPGNNDVGHEPSNYKKDNREKLILIPRNQRKNYNF
jgi:hypothetical protein|tara:strand:- start:6234 stop:6443 length:210 start_codon:yes stop_codon:yes gene_type:complete